MALAGLAAGADRPQGRHYWEYIDTSGTPAQYYPAEYDEPLCHDRRLYLDQLGRHDKPDETGYQRSIDRKVSDRGLDAVDRLSAERCAPGRHPDHQHVALERRQRFIHGAVPPRKAILPTRGTGSFSTSTAPRTPCRAQRHAGPYQFQVLTWTGTQYTSYAAAVGQPNTYTGRSPCSRKSTCYSIMPPMPNYGYLNNMPAIIMQPQLPGDANGDGKVDINDLTIVLANYDQTGMNWNAGDFTGSGKVDINDLTIVLANYDRRQPGGAAGVGAVPEPVRAGPARPGADRSVGLGGAH